MKIRRVCLSSAVLAALAVPAAAAAAPSVTGEFSTGASQPGRLALGSDGNIWATIKSGGGADDVIRVTPDGVVTQFDVSNIANPTTITAGPGGDLWVGRVGELAHFSPAAPTVGTKVTIAGLAEPRGLVMGADGNVWAAGGTDVVRVTPAGAFTKFTVSLNSALQGMKAGSDGNLYVADDNVVTGGQVVRVTPAGATTPFPAGTGGIRELAEGPGGQFAFTAPVSAPERIGLMIPPAAAVTKDVAPIDPTGIVFGNDGAYWIANFGGSVLTRLTTAGEMTTLTGFTANAGTREIVKGPGDTLWVNEENINKIARVSGVEAPQPEPPTTTTTTTTTTTPTTTQTTTTTPPPPPTDTAAPVVVLRKPSPVTRGTSFPVSLTLSERATVTAQLQRSASGRRKAGRCVKPTRKLRRAKRCTRTLTPVARAFGQLGPGAASFRMPTKNGTRKIAPGRYRLVVSARDAAGNVGKATTSVTVRG